MVTASQKYLSGHDGTVYFAVGKRATEMQCEVNDQEFDVFLQIVFRNKASHDKYQKHPRHLKFIEQNKHLWSDVRVFDSYLASPQADSLPEVAAGFAGMIRGKVVSKRGKQFIVAVHDIPKTWRTNRAEQPKVLVGKKVLVDGSRSTNIARFVASLKIGERVALDVAHKEGDTLKILELTAEQREVVQSKE